MKIHPIAGNVIEIVDKSGKTAITVLDDGEGNFDIAPAGEVIPCVRRTLVIKEFNTKSGEYDAVIFPRRITVSVEEKKRK